MSVTASATVISTAAAIQVINNEKIEKQRCVLVVDGFDNSGASVEEMKDYSYCVQKLYPEPTTEGENLALKAGVFILLVSLAVGVIRGYREGKIEGAFLLGITLPLGIFALMLVSVFCYAGVVFLIS